MEVGWRRFWNDLRRKRYRFRQAMGGAFSALLVILAQPKAWAFPVGLALIAAGALVRLWAAGHVHKNEVLATDGPYAFVRHPQYLGNCILALGFSLASGLLWAIAAWAVLFYLFYVPAIRREDDKLHRRFGQAWESWRAKTPAVLPTRWPGPGADMRLKDWSVLQSIRNGEPIWLTLMTAAVVSFYLRAH